MKEREKFLRAFLFSIAFFVIGFFVNSEHVLATGVGSICEDKATCDGNLTCRSSVPGGQWTCQPPQNINGFCPSPDAGSFSYCVEGAVCFFKKCTIGSKDGEYCYDLISTSTATTKVQPCAHEFMCLNEIKKCVTVSEYQKVRAQQESDYNKSKGGAATAQTAIAGTCKPKCSAGETQSGTCPNGEVKCVSSSAASSTRGSNISIPNPLKYSTVNEFVSSVMAAIRGIVVTLAILAIVIGGVLYVISAGNSGLMTMAKGAITGALIGLAIVIAAPSFLKEVYTIVGGKNPTAELQQALSLTQIAMNTLNFLLSIVGIIAIIMLIIGGMAYLTSGGDSKRADVGKEIVKNALIGITIVMAALIIVKAIAGLLMGNAIV